MRFMDDFVTLSVYDVCVCVYVYTVIYECLYCLSVMCVSVLSVCDI